MEGPILISATVSALPTLELSRVSNFSSTSLVTSPYLLTAAEALELAAEEGLKLPRSHSTITRLALPPWPHA